MLKVDDFKDWHPPIEMATTSFYSEPSIKTHISLCARPDFNICDITFYVLVQEGSDNAYTKTFIYLETAIEYFNKLLKGAL